MNAEEALREIGKICERVGDKCCEKEAVYKVGNVVMLSFGGFQSTGYYIIASTGYSMEIVLLNLSTGCRHQIDPKRVTDKMAISQEEMDCMLSGTVTSTRPSTLQEAAANI